MSKKELACVVFVLLFCGEVLSDIHWIEPGSIDTYMPIEQGRFNNNPVTLQTNWTENTGAAGYTYNDVWSQLPASDNILVTAANVISLDARIIAGTGITENTTYFNTGILWRLDSVSGGRPIYTFDKLNVPDGYDNSNVWNMSENGSFIVGACSKGYYLTDETPAYWTADNAVHSLGVLEYNNILYGTGLALAVSNNNTIVGEIGNTQGTLAFIYDKQQGMRYLGDMLKQDWGHDVGGILTTASYISPDGKTILGRGLKETGDGYTLMEYQVTIPEPLTIVLLSLGALGLRRRK